MNTYFIRGLKCTAYIGQQTWQKSVLQKITMDIEWQNPNSSELADNTAINCERLITEIIELSSAKHWETLAMLGDQIKQVVNAQLNTHQFNITLSIPNPFAQTETIGITINYP